MKWKTLSGVCHGVCGTIFFLNELCSQPRVAQKCWQKTQCTESIAEQKVSKKGKGVETKYSQYILQNQSRFQLMTSNHRSCVGFHCRLKHKGRGHYTCLLVAELLNILLGHSAVGMRQRQNDKQFWVGRGYPLKSHRRQRSKVATTRCNQRSCMTHR